MQIAEILKTFAVLFPGPRRLAEAGSVRGRAPESYILLKVHDHLRYAAVLLGPEAGRALEDLRRAQALIEHRLGYIPLPPEGAGPSLGVSGHLQNAAALCREHFGGSRWRPEGFVLRAVERVLKAQTLRAGESRAADARFGGAV